jgi:hypothetical protein
MSVSKLQQLSDAMDLTNQMQALAEKAQWEQIIQLDKQRQDLFSQIFPLNNVDVSSGFQEKLHDLVELNNQLETFCASQKQDLQLQMQGLNKNKKAINAYQST